MEDTELVALSPDEKMLITAATSFYLLSNEGKMSQKLLDLGVGILFKVGNCPPVGVDSWKQ